MANHKSAEKRARQTVKRNKLNRSRRSALHTIMTEVDAAVAKGDKDATIKAARKAEGALARTANRGTLHWKTAARKASRLAKRIKLATKG